MRDWHEVNYTKLSLNQKKGEPLNHKWYPCASGGKFRKWYGNQNLIVNFENGGANIESYAEINKNSFGFNGSKYYFKKSITWPKLTSSLNSFRATPTGHIFDGVGLSAFFDTDQDYYSALALLNSNLYKKIIAVLAPTLSFTSGDFLKLPFISIECESEIKTLIDIHQKDWDLSEVSFNFKENMLLATNSLNLIESYNFFIEESKKDIDTALYLEQYLNALIYEKLKIEPSEDDLIIPLEQLSLKINDHYEYGKSNKDKRKSESLSQFVSYSVGCMMGRYSLDQEGLVYAHSGNEGFDASLYQTFPADSDGIIPITDEEWFKDDVSNRVVEFVKTVWGEENLAENLEFIADSLCLDAIKPRKSETAIATIRRYLSTQFYKDHMQTYRSRPIYWLFSSGKEKAFECLVYLHRYNESTLSRMRTEYVTPLLGKYEAYAEQLDKQIDMAESTQDKKRLERELKGMDKKQSELREFDDKLKHYADMRISIDLDDGVKENYGKFGDLLAEVKKITGKKPEMINAN